jgi:hypothetical protein
MEPQVPEVILPLQMKLPPSCSTLEKRSTSKLGALLLYEGNALAPGLQKTVQEVRDCF